MFYPKYFIEGFYARNTKKNTPQKKSKILRLHHDESRRGGGTDVLPQRHR